MSFNVGTLYAAIDLDIKGFNRNLDASERALRSFAKATTTAGKTVATTFTAGTTAAAALTGKLLAQGKAYNQLQQNSRAALRSIMGDAKAANAQMDKLDEFATKSPFSKSVFITAQQQMLGFGMAADKVLPTLDAIQNAVAATGGSSQQVGELAYVIAQIQSVGKITAQDLMQLGVRGVDAARMIGDAMGKTPAQVREMITRGTLDVNTALDALVKGMDAKFKGATAGIKQQMSGAVDRVKAATRDIGAALAKPFIDPHGGGYMVVWANRYADVLRQAQRLTEGVMSTVERRYGTAFKAVSTHIGNAASALARMDSSKLTNKLDGLEKYGPVLAGVASGMTAIALRGVPVIGALNPMAAALGAVAVSSPQARQALAGIAREAQHLAPTVQAVAHAVGDFLLHAISQLAPLAEASGKAFVKLVDASSPLALTLVRIADAALPIVSLMSGLVDVISKLPTPLLTAGAAFTMIHLAVGKFPNTVKAVKALGSSVMEAGTAFAGFYRTARDTAGMQGVSTGLVMTATAATRASSAIRAIGAAMKTAFITNAPMLAITGLVTVLSLFVAQKQKAQQATEAFAATLDKETGKITENTRAWASQKANEEDMIKARETIGVSSETLTRALMQEKDAMEEVRKAADTYMRNSAGGTWNASVNGTRETVKGLQDLMAATSEAAAKNRDMAASEREVTSNIEAQSRAMEENHRISEARANARGALKSAEYALADALEAYNQRMETAVAGTNDHGKALLSVVEAINREESAARKAGESQEQLNARRQANLKTLEPMARAFIEAQKGAAATKAEVDQLLASYGLLDAPVTMQITLNAAATEAELSEFLKKATGKDHKIRLDVDSAPVLQKLDGVFGTLNQDTHMLEVDADVAPMLASILKGFASVDENGVITVNGDTDQLEAKIQGLFSTYDRTVVTIDANGDPAEATINALDVLAAAGVSKPVQADIDMATETLEMLTTLVETGAIKPVDADIAGAYLKNGQLIEAISLLATKPVDANTADALKKNLKLATAIAEKATKPVDANTTNALRKADTLHDEAGKPVSKGVSIYKQGDWNISSWIPSSLSIGLNIVRSAFMADGGIQYFANGGENHRAQIAPAGSWRVWAEPETGGEAYIPLALGKRARSTQILSEVASKFGYTLVPNGAAHHAAGSTTGGAPTPLHPGYPDRVILQVEDKEFTAYLKQVATNTYVTAERWRG